jgi:hypothetical protein
MRALLGLLALIGLAGIAFGVLTIIHGMGNDPFSYENYGGPGPVIGGVLLLSVSLYLRSISPRNESRARAARHV